MLEQQLQSLRDGKSKRVKGINVRRDGSLYIIDGDSLTIAEAVARLNETAKVTGIDYASTAFVEKTPGNNSHTSGIVKIHRLKSKADHTALVEAVKSRRNCLWYGKVVRDGGRCWVQPPLIIDFDSIDSAKTTDEPVIDDNVLSCPFCNKVVSSTSGRTLHVKYEHPARMDEYVKLMSKKASSGDSSSGDSLQCSVCGKKCSSTSGFTLHMKKHS